MGWHPSCSSAARCGPPCHACNRQVVTRRCLPPQPYDLPCDVLQFGFRGGHKSNQIGKIEANMIQIESSQRALSIGAIGFARIHDFTPKLHRWWFRKFKSNHVILKRRQIKSNHVIKTMRQIKSQGRKIYCIGIKATRMMIWVLPISLFGRFPWRGSPPCSFRWSKWHGTRRSSPRRGHPSRTSSAEPRQ